MAERFDARKAAIKFEAKARMYGFRYHRVLSWSSWQKLLITAFVDKTGQQVVVRETRTGFAQALREMYGRFKRQEVAEKSNPVPRPDDHEETP